MPSIIVTTCIALIALLISPALTVVEALALAISLSVVITVFSLQTYSIADHKEDETVTRNAQNIVRAAFLGLAKDSRATSTSFKVVNGMVAHQRSAIGVPESGEVGSATGIGLEEDALSEMD